MNYKRNIAVLLFLAALTLGVFLAPTGPITSTASASSPVLSPETQDKINQWYDQLSQPGFTAKVDPLLANWKTGELSTKVVTIDGAVSALVVCAPWVDEATVRSLVSVDWVADLIAMKTMKVTIPSADALNALARVKGVGIVDADVYLMDMDTGAIEERLATVEPLETEIGLDMYHIRELVGATTAPASSYTGDGVTVAHIDSGADFGNPELVDAYEWAYDPTGYGAVYTKYRANATNVNVTEWLSDPYNLLTYTYKGHVYLNVTTWDPILNTGPDFGGSRYLIGDGDYSAPYHDRIGFIWLYAYYWGIDGVDKILPQIWQDIELPIISNIDGHYILGWMQQRRYTPYARIFAPWLVYNTTAGEYHAIVNWEDTMGWNYLWTGGFYYETLDFEHPIDRRLVVNQFDWSFADEYAAGEIIDVNNPIVAYDYTGDGIFDFSLGALCTAYYQGALSGLTSPRYFEGFHPTGNGLALYYDHGTHGTATAAHVAARGVLNYTHSESGWGTSTFQMKGIAPDAKLLSVRAITTGSMYGGFIWGCGFDLNTTSGEWYYTGDHLADISTNSWGWITSAASELDYLGLTWDILAVPGVLDPAYPGVLHVFSAGNEGEGFMTVAPPGAAAGVLTVGASTSSHWLEYLYGPTQPYEGLASFTSRGPDFTGYVKPDILAPGLAGYSSVPWFDQYMASLGVWSVSAVTYTLFSGTSQAAPVAAGCAALLYEAAAGFDNPYKAKMILQQTAKDLGYDPACQGFGRIDIAAAVDMVENGGLVSYNVNSWNNHADVLSDAWEYWGTLPAPYLGLEIDPLATQYPTDIWEGSLYFGYVSPLGTYTISQRVYSDSFTTMVDFSSLTDYDAYTYQAMDTFTFTDTTFVYNDTLTGELAYGYYNLRDQLGVINYTTLLNYNYFTIAVSFSSDDLTAGNPWMFLYDWVDNESADGIPNLWNGTYGDELHRLTSAAADSNTNAMSWAVPRTTTLGAELLGNLTLVIHDPIHDVNASATGNDFTATVICWDIVSANNITFSDPGTEYTVNITLTVPGTPEYGIHQGFVYLEVGNESLLLPYSFMCVPGLEDEATTYTVAQDGDPLEPYDDNVYGILGEDPGTWDFRNFAVSISNDSAAYLGVRVVWENAGNDMAVEVLDMVGESLATGTASTISTTAVIAEISGSGIYYIFVHPVALEEAELPAAYTLEVMWYAEIPTADDIELTYTANDVPTPVPVNDLDTCVGDHVVLNARYPVFNLSGMPEYEVVSMDLQFLSGLYETKSGPLVTYSGSYNPFTGAPIDLTKFAWERFDGIVSGDDVRLSVTFDIGDCDVMVWWADTDNATWTYTNNLVGDTMASGANPEEGNFIADRDGSIMVGIFNYDNEPGTYSVTVDTRAGSTVHADDRTVSYDTYQFLKNGSFSIIVSSYTPTNIDFEVNYARITFDNFFAPTMQSVTVTAQGSNVFEVTWNATDRNAGDDLYYEVYLSADSGLTYQLLDSNRTTTSYQWNSTDFLEKDTYRFKIVVYDNDPDQGIAAPGSYWTGMSDEMESEDFSAGAQTTPTTTTTTTTPTPTTTTVTVTVTVTIPPPIDPLVAGTFGGLLVGVIVVLILYLLRKK